MLGYQITHCLMTIQQKAKAPFRFLGLYDSSVVFATLEQSIGSAVRSWCAVLNVNSTHWLLLFFDAARQLLVFGDSLGLDLAQYNLPLSVELQTVLGAGRLIHLPGYPVQEREARTCGLFVVFWAAQLSRGTPLNQICSVFPPNQRVRNDLHVTYWFQSNFPSLFNSSWI